jgi:thiamine biosynthesis lipoprotein
LSGAVAPASPYWIRVHRTAMACRFEVTLSGEDANAVGRAQFALAEAERLEERMSVFRDTSELTAVNRHAADRPVRVSRELFNLLQRCRSLHDDTGGAFDITSTPLSRCWGFLRRAGRVPGTDAIAAARELVGGAHLHLDPSSRTVRFARSGMELNLGSIGKGFAVHRIAVLLKRAGLRHALVSAAGSSIYALGRRGAWPITLTSRRVADGRIARLLLRHGAMATSGIGEQYVDADGRRYAHVLDPRTGWPAEGLASVTVVTSDAAVADALATAFLVGGEALARRYCAEHPNTMSVLTPDRGTGRPSVIGEYAGVEVEEL